MMCIGALVLNLAGDALSRMNKDMRLYDLVIQNAKEPQNIPPLDVEVFYAQGGTLETLSVRAENILDEFRTAATVAGGFIGLVTGCMFIGLSLKRSRKTYEIDDAACVNCGRCFRYCPQNKNGCQVRIKN
jgi:NAD-dependent dihydropyrimidine dehydrogenase PreA subunit